MLDALMFAVVLYHLPLNWIVVWVWVEWELESISPILITFMVLDDIVYVFGSSEPTTHILNSMFLR